MHSLSITVVRCLAVWSKTHVAGQAEAVSQAESCIHCCRPIAPLIRNRNDNRSTRSPC